MGNGLVWFPFASVTVSSLSLHSSLLQMDISQIQTKLNLVCLTMISFLLNKLIDLKAVWCLFTMWPSKCPLSYLKPDEISEAFPLVLGFPLLWDVQAFSSRCENIGIWNSHVLFLALPQSIQDLSSQPGMGSRSLAVRAWSPNHRTTREIPTAIFLYFFAAYSKLFSDANIR